MFLSHFGLGSESRKSQLTSAEIIISKLAPPSRHYLDMSMVGLIGIVLFLCVGRPWIFFNIQPFEPYDEKRLLEIVLLLIFATIFVLSEKTRDRWLSVVNGLPPYTGTALAAILALAALSIVNAADPGRAALDFSFYILGLYLALSLASIRREIGKKFDSLIIGFIAASAFIYLFFFFFVYFDSFSETTELSSEIVDDVKALVLFPNFSNRRFFDQFQTWTLPLIVLPLVLFRVKHLISKVALYLIASGWWTLFFIGDGRGKALGVIISLLGVIAIYRKHIRPWLSLQATAALGGFLIYWVIFVLLAPETGIGLVRDAPAGRLELWSLAANFVIDHPLLGQGPSFYFPTDEIRAAHPHNALVQWAAEWGLPSAIIVGALFMAAFAAWVRWSREVLHAEPEADTQILLPALTASCLAAVTHAMVSGIIVMPMSQITLIAICGWMLGLYQGRGAGTPDAPKKWKSRSLALIVLIAAGTIIAQGYRESPAAESVTPQNIGADAMPTPRIWLNGWSLPVSPK